MAMGLGKGNKALRGRETVEPAFGMPAIWIPETERKAAERNGYIVIDPLTVMVTHLAEILKRNLSEMISRQDVQEMLNRLKETNAAVVQELGQLQISTGLVQRILQNLLREGVSVRELSVILERLCDQHPYTNRRLGLHPPGQGRGLDPGHRQWRYRDARRRAARHSTSPAPTAS